MSGNDRSSLAKRRTGRSRTAPNAEAEQMCRPSLPVERGARVYGAVGWTPNRSDRRGKRKAHQVEVRCRRELMEQRRAVGVLTCSGPT